MEVMKITTRDGSTYHTNRTSDLATLWAKPEVVMVEKVRMTDEEYQAIPASNASATFFA
jgi:hypothetical protein